VSLEGEVSQHFDVLVLDAFRGASVPVYLLTVEAFAVYLRHLQPGGTLVVNVTNRYVDLRPVVRAQANHFGLTSILIQSSGDPGLGTYACSYVLLAREPSWLSDPNIIHGARGWDRMPSRFPLWKDDYSSLLDVIVWR